MFSEQLLIRGNHRGTKIWTSIFPYVKHLSYGLRTPPWTTKVYGLRQVEFTASVRHPAGGRGISDLASVLASECVQVLSEAAAKPESCGALKAASPPPASSFSLATWLLGGSRFHADGLGALLRTLANPTPSASPGGAGGTLFPMASCVALSLAHLLDAPYSRRFFGRSDLRQLTAPLTNLELHAISAEEWQASPMRPPTLEAMRAAI